jgi:hypothetical protein
MRGRLFEKSLPRTPSKNFVLGWDSDTDMPLNTADKYKGGNNKIN